MALQLVQDATHGPNLKLVRPSAVEPVGLGDRLVEMGWRASDSHHQVVRLAAEFAGTVEWSVAGCSSAAQWMSERLDVALRTAREWIAVGRALRGLPVLDAALSDRTLSCAKVRMLVRTATPETESELVGLARSVSAGALGSAVAAWSRAHEPEDVRDERHRETRGLSWRVEPDGLTTGTLRLPADVAGGVMALIDAAVMRHRRSRGDRDAAHVSDPEFIEDDLGAQRLSRPWRSNGLMRWSACCAAVERTWSPRWSSTCVATGQRWTTAARSLSRPLSVRCQVVSCGH